MESEILVRFDWAIKSLLRDKANFPILEGFLSELLGKDVTINSLLESESNPKDSTDKINRVDLLAELGSGEKMVIEVQCARQWNFLWRMAYGASKVVAQSLKKGKNYNEVPKVISVNILYFDLGEGDGSIFKGTTQFHSLDGHGMLHLPEREKKYYSNFSGDISEVFPEYYILKVNQFNHSVKSTLDEWMYFLKESEVKSEFKAKGIQEAGEKLRVMRLSQSERRSYEHFIDDVRSEKSVLETYFTDGFFEGKDEGLVEGKKKGLKEGLLKGKEVGLKEGLKEGLLKGKEETQREMIQKMSQSGISLEQISLFSGLSQKKIQKFLES